MPPILYQQLAQVPESAYAAELQAILTELESTTRASYDKEKQGRAARSAHAKSYGILRGSLEVLPGLDSELAQGIFAAPATYEAVIRFSNGLGHLGPDASLGPIFGMGVKLFGVAGRSIVDEEEPVSNFDYAMINGPVFFANTAKDYVAIQRLFEKLPGALRDPGTAKSWLHDFLTCEGTLPPEGWLWDELFALMSLVKTPWRNPLLATYWTMGAVRHGDYVAKLRAAPDASAAAQVSRRELNPLANPEPVRDSLVAEIGEHDFSFCLEAQLCTDQLRMPVDNTSIEWSERLSPFVKVATIHIPKQDISPEANLEIADRTSVTPWRTRESHMPLGEIMTARREVYRRSAQLRREINRQPQREPSSADEVFDSVRSVL